MKIKFVIGLIFVVLGFASACTSRQNIAPTATPIVSPTKIATAIPTTQATNFVLKSSKVVEGGALPRDYTCDGLSATLPLEWSGAPSGTKSFAVVMHYIPPEVTPYWYWIVYNIPPNVTKLPKNVQGIGTLGNNSVNGKTQYSPPCSKGPGEKIYTYTVYALSAEPQLTVPASKVNGDVLLAAIKDITLASAQLNVTYSR
jgi:Raf kinase inhibitor-like YbhB/YbcL family protein